MDLDLFPTFGRCRGYAHPVREQAGILARLAATRFKEPFPGWARSGERGWCQWPHPSYFTEEEDDNCAGWGASITLYRCECPPDPEPLCSLPIDPEHDAAADALYRLASVPHRALDAIERLVNATGRACQCPECEGHGWGPNTLGMDNTVIENDCSVCDGKGFIWPKLWTPLRRY